MGLDDLSRPIAGRAIPYVVIGVKPTRHGTECGINNLGLGLAMDAQNLIVVNKRCHGFPTTSGQLGPGPIVSRRVSGHWSEVITPSRSSVATSTDDHMAASVFRINQPLEDIEAQLSHDLGVRNRLPRLS
jgi:hypothetical protein